MRLKSTEVIALWHDRMDESDDLDEFVARFQDDQRAELAEIARLEARLTTLTGEPQKNTAKMIRIKEILVDFRLKLSILKVAHRREFSELGRAVLRDKLKTASYLCFRIGPDHKLEVVFRSGTDDWLLVDGGSEVLPCSLHYLLGRSKWIAALRELELLINSAGTTENDLQKFFELYPEFVAGHTYDTVIPQAVIVPDATEYKWKADFVLSPFNQFDFASVLELKVPSVKTTVTKGTGHHSFSSQLWHAIRQVKDYAGEFDNPNVRSRFQRTYGVNIFKPDVHLIAGRGWDIAQINSVRRMKKDAQIRIETWEEVLTRLKREFS